MEKKFKLQKINLIGNNQDEEELKIVDNPQKELLQDPKWSILEDGNGYQVLAMGGVPFKDKEGRKCVKFKIIPDNLVRNRYNLRKGPGGELDDQDGSMYITCLAIDLIPLNIYDDSNRKWLYIKTFKHEPTDLSEREVYLKTQLAGYEKEVLLLQGQVIQLSESLNLATLNAGKFLSQSGEIFEKVTNTVASAMNKKKEDEK